MEFVGQPNVDRFHAATIEPARLNCRTTPVAGTANHPTPNERHLASMTDQHLFNITDAIPNPRPSTVGLSDRTPAKHQLMDKLFGREVGCAMYNPGISNLVWLDLTAGEGAPAPNDDPKRQAWYRRCSPGLLAYHARNPEKKTGRPTVSKPVRVVLHEKAPGTYEILLENLAKELPTLGYRRVGETEWACGFVTFSALNVEGGDADLSIVNPCSAVMISNDPNKITDWVMPQWMPKHIRSVTPWFQGISTMGCNVGGLLRLPSQDRAAWYPLVGSLVDGLPNHHDLHLSAIDRDASRWGYLAMSPNKASKFRDWRTDTDKAARSAFGDQGFSLRTAWWRSAPSDFESICDYLFKTAAERGE